MQGKSHFREKVTALDDLSAEEFLAEKTGALDKESGRYMGLLDEKYKYEKFYNPPGGPDYEAALQNMYNTASSAWMDKE